MRTEHVIEAEYHRLLNSKYAKIYIDEISALAWVMGDFKSIAAAKKQIFKEIKND